MRIPRRRLSYMLIYPVAFLIIPSADILTSPSAGAGFPYSHEEEIGRPAYQTQRAEGIDQQLIKDSVIKSLRYLKKYVKKRYLYPEETVVYFNHQKELLNRIGTEPVGSPHSLRLAMIGDIMWVRDHWSDYISPEVQAHLAGHDVVIGNLETPIAPSHLVDETDLDADYYNSRPELVTAFKRADGRPLFSALAYSNNHVFDQHDHGVNETLEQLKTAGILQTGVAKRKRTEEKPYALIVRNGIRIGFYASSWGYNDIRYVSQNFTQNVLPGIAPDEAGPADVSPIRDILDAMERDGVDLKIVYLHMGFEYEFMPTANLMITARRIIEAGADILLASHPHVLNPSEICFVNGAERVAILDYGNLASLEERSGCILKDARHSRPRRGLIHYSTGNFATNMLTDTAKVGVIQEVMIVKGPDGHAGWRRPRHTLIYNLIPDHYTTGDSHRSIILAEEYAAAGKGDRLFRQTIEFYRGLMRNPSFAFPSSPPDLDFPTALNCYRRFIDAMKSHFYDVPLGMLLIPFV